MKVYQDVQEVTPEKMQCNAGIGCPAAYMAVREVTPESERCGIGACPAVYEGVREISPKDFNCGVGPCPGIYEAQSHVGVYLVIGKQVNPKEAGLERKVGQGEVLIEVPRELIDEMERNK